MHPAPNSPAHVVAADLVGGAAAAAAQADLPSRAAAGAALLHQVAAGQAAEARLCAAAAPPCNTHHTHTGTHYSLQMTCNVELLPVRRSGNSTREQSAGAAQGHVPSSFLQAGPFFLTKRAIACKHDQLLQAEPPAVPGEVASIAVATSHAVTSKHQQPTSTNSNCCSTAAPPHRTQHTARSTHHCTRCLARSSAPLSESCLPGTPASLPAAAAAWRSDPE